MKKLFVVFIAIAIFTGVADGQVVIHGIINAAQGTAISPGGLVSIFGSFGNVATAQASSLPLPLELSRIWVTLSGVPMPILFVSPGQINAQVPWEFLGTAPFRGSVEVRRLADDSAAAIPVQVNLAGPGLFAERGWVIVQNAVTLTLVRNAESAVKAGNIVSVYGTGWGPVQGIPKSGGPDGSNHRCDLKLTAAIGGKPAEVKYCGLSPGSVGLFQANIQMPEGLPPGELEGVLTLSTGFVKFEPPAEMRFKVWVRQ